MPTGAKSKLNVVWVVPHADAHVAAAAFGGASPAKLADRFQQLLPDKAQAAMAGTPAELAAAALQHAEDIHEAGKRAARAIGLELTSISSRPAFGPPGLHVTFILDHDEPEPPQVAALQRRPGVTVVVHRRAAPDTTLPWYVTP